jgi:hypothetical protein
VLIERIADDVILLVEDEKFLFFVESEYIKVGLLLVRGEGGGAERAVYHRFRCERALVGVLGRHLQTVGDGAGGDGEREFLVLGQHYLFGVVGEALRGRLGEGLLLG